MLRNTWSASYIRTLLLQPPPTLFYLIGANDVVHFDPSCDVDETEYEDIHESIVFETNANEQIQTVEVDNLEELVLFDPEILNEEPNPSENEVLSRVSASICRKMMKFCKCEDCKRVFAESNEIFVRDCKTMLRALNLVIPHICHETALKAKLISKLDSVEIGVLGCQDHFLQTTQTMKELSADRTITSFCNDVNSFLTGKINTLPKNHNRIQELAIIHRRKHKKIGKYSDIFML